MTMMPPRSSATASAARNTFSPRGHLLLKMLSTPSEKAMSVAMGIAMPRCMSGLGGHTRMNTMTGMSMPPQAPITGASAFLTEESSPHRTSRLISSPTLRKNIAIRKSLMNVPKDIGTPPWLKMLKPPILTLTGSSHKRRYISPQGLFATMRAATVAMINKTLLLMYFRSMLMNA